MENEKKTAGVINIIIILCFAGFLLALAAAGLFRERETYSYYENRMLARKPELTAESVASGEYFKGLDSYLADQAPGRRTLLKADTLINMRLFGLPVVNDVVVRDDILLPYLDYGMFDLESVPEKAEAMAENLKSVRDAAEEAGAAFYYVAVPCQYAYFEDEYPWYLNNNAEYTAASRRALKEALDEAGVEHMDAGDVFAALGSPKSLGSRVDNHYPLYAAFLVSRALLERIGDDRGLDIHVPEESEVLMGELPNPYLGSRNRKLMGLWSNDERLAWMEPVEDIPFRRWDSGAEREGTVYQWPASEWEDVTYSFYMGGDVAETVIDTGRDELPSVLIYGDSFTNAMECVMYMSFNETRSLDLRHYKEKTLGEYIRETGPDVVICVRDYEVLLDPNFNGQSADGAK